MASLRRGSVCNVTATPRARANSAAAALRVSSTRLSNRSAVAASAREISGEPSKSAISLSPPNRRPRPLAINTHPSNFSHSFFLKL